MSENRSQLGSVKIRGIGTSRPPDGITPEEAERLAREADEQREREGR